MPQYVLPQDELTKKKKRRRNLFLLLLLMVLVIFLLWVLFGSDIFVTKAAYRPVLEFSLDMSHLGKPPILLLSLEFPKVQFPDGELSFKLPDTTSGTIPSDGTPFSPKVLPKATFYSVSKTLPVSCKSLSVSLDALSYDTITPPGSKTTPGQINLVLPLPSALNVTAPKLSETCLLAIQDIKGDEPETLSLSKEEKKVGEEVGVSVPKPFTTDTGFLCPDPMPDLTSAELSPQLLEELLKCLPKDKCGNGVIEAAEDCDPPGALQCPGPGGPTACSAVCTCGLVPPWRKDLPPISPLDPFSSGTGIPSGARVPTPGTVVPVHPIEAELLREARKTIGQEALEFFKELLGISVEEERISATEVIKRAVTIPPRPLISVLEPVVKFIEKFISVRDNDSDGLLDRDDPDDDNDGTVDSLDDTPRDHDEDGLNDDIDPDDDGDEILDVEEDENDWYDLDNDEFEDSEDEDLDGDGIKNENEEPGEEDDTDNDGKDNWEDSDDDSDGVPDTAEAELFAGKVNAKSYALDTDNDGIGNEDDPDDDGDNIPDKIDKYDLDEDNDGVDDGEDTDDDNDGVQDFNDPDEIEYRYKLFTVGIFDAAPIKTSGVDKCYLNKLSDADVTNNEGEVEADCSGIYTKDKLCKITGKGLTASGAEAYFEEIVRDLNGYVRLKVKVKAPAVTVHVDNSSCPNKNVFVATFRAGGTAQGTCPSRSFSSPTTPLADCNVNVACSSVNVDITDENADTSFSISSGSLPDGLSMTPTTGTSVRISGTPTVDGTFTFGITATLGSCSYTSGTLTQTIRP